MKKPILNQGCTPTQNYSAGWHMPGTMVKKTILFLAFVLCLAGCSKNQLKDAGEPLVTASSKSTASVKAITGTFKVMSINVRSDNAADPQSMTERQPMLRQLIVDNTPDIFGVQEFSTNSFEDWYIAQMATLGYGVYKDEVAGYGSPKCIFYKTSRFTMESSGTVRIEVTNLVTATWAVMVDNTNAKKYFISNSHWQDGSGTQADAWRMENANTLISSINQQNTQALPVIVMGDFNCVPNSAAYNQIKNGLDMVEALGGIQGLPTFHGWGSTGTNKIDMLMSTRNMTFTTQAVIMTNYSATWGSPGWPSDHWQIIVTYAPTIFANTQNDVNGISASSITKYSFADVNGDNFEDKIYWNTGFDSGKPQVFLAIGNGTFATTAVVNTTGASTYSTTRYYYADLNGDGKDDEILWTPTLNAGHTRVMLATTGGNFSSTIIDNPEGISTSSTTVYNFADVNGDGRADKIVWNSGVDAGHTQVYLATTTDGTFSASVISGPEGASTTVGTSFYYADMNADGKADKIYWHPTLSSGRPQVYLSDGDGTFTASSSFNSSGSSSGASATKFYFADINGDNRADEILWNPAQFQGMPRIYYNETNNAFSGAIFSLRGTSESANTNYYFADINGDGKEDQIRWNYAEYSGQLRNWLAL